MDFIVDNKVRKTKDMQLTLVEKEMDSHVLL